MKTTKEKKNELKSIKECNFLTGCLLCGAMVFSGFLPVSATETASQYEIEDTVLKITIPEGMTNEVDVSKVACANNNEITEIRKLGRGGFLMNDKTAIPNYTGDIFVDQGTWIVACTNALGKLDDGKGEDTGEVFVADGATIDMASTDRYLSNAGKKITIKGNGVSGEGALTVSIKATNYYKDVLGNNIVLEGDALIGMPQKFNLYFLNSIVNLNGHKLTVKGGESIGNMVLGGQTGVGTTVESGQLEFNDYGSLLLQHKILFKEGSRIILNDDAELGIKMYGRYEVPITWNSSGRVVSTETPGSNVAVPTNQNTWHGPVALTKSMRVALSSQGSFGLLGKVTGEGGLDMYFNGTIPEVPTNAVTLANPNNDFQGGISAKGLIVNVLENGAVPTEGGVFALTNSIVNFVTNKNYMLPDGIIHVTGEKSVTGGRGKWNTLVKTGAGTVNYDSAIGADVLELREGVLKVSMQPAVYAGLIEGVEYFDDANLSSSAAKNAEIAYTNGVVLSPYLVNSAMKTYWTTFRPDRDVENQTIKGHCTTYTGYMWNRETTNVMWTFVSCVANVTTLHIDGKQLFSHQPTTSARTLGNATIEVTPGAHRFRIGNHSRYHSNDMLKTEGGMSGSVTEWKGMGLRWDPLGRGTTNKEHFVVLEDPGDGSLFTWALPGEDVFYPGTDENNKIGKFRRVKFAGGTLYLNGVTNTVAELEGIPSVAGNGKVFIESKWTIDAADIADGSEVSGLSFGFGADVELEIENSSAAKSMTGTREWTVIKSAEDITGSITVKDEDMAKRWTVNIDGNEVKLKYRPFGTAVIIR